MIKKIRNLVQKVLPLVYDDAISYYEAISKCRDKINELTEVVNEHSKVIDGVAKAETLYPVYVDYDPESAPDAEAIIKLAEEGHPVYLRGTKASDTFIVPLYYFSHSADYTRCILDFADCMNQMTPTLDDKQWNDYITKVGNIRYNNRSGWFLGYVIDKNLVTNTEKTKIEAL